MAIIAAPLVPIDQRFAQLIQQFGLTKNSFAMSLGKTASVVQHLIDGRNKPGYDLLCRVFEIYPNVSRDWLLLGRGPMLVGGDLVPKAVAPVVTTTISEPPLEPIDLADVELPAHRRASAGVAGSRLQPAEIAATLALATAANQAAHTAVSTPEPPSVPTETPVASRPAEALSAAEPAAPAKPFEPSEPLAAPTTETHFANNMPPVVPPVMPSPAAAIPAPGPQLVAVPSPEIYVAAALHAQHLQHQLALAELRNQHLVEQQQMLREMLAMARQAMV